MIQDMNRQYSQKLSDILEYSREEAGRLRCDSIGPEHLLLALLRDGNNAATDLLNKLHVNLPSIKSEIENDIERCNNFNDTARSLDLNAMANKVMRLCLLEARVLKQTVTDAEHLLLALLRDGDNAATELLNKWHADLRHLKQEVESSPAAKRYKAMFLNFIIVCF